MHLSVKMYQQMVAGSPVVLSLLLSALPHLASAGALPEQGWFDKKPKKITRYKS